MKDNNSNKENINSLFENKICLKCQSTKAFSEFTKSKTGKFGLHNWCRDCLSEYNKNIYKNNREEKIQKSTEWNQENYKKVKKYKRKSYIKHSSPEQRYSTGPEITDKREINF